MNSHINAKTTTYARARTMDRNFSGVSVRDIAAAFGVSQCTVLKWLARFRAGDRAVLINRSSRPHLRPGVDAAGYREAALLVRRAFRMTGEQIAKALRLARLLPAELLRGYQRKRPGELTHIDNKKPSLSS